MPDAVPAPDAGPLAGERETRAIVTARLRAADLRVRYDVPLTLGEHTVVLDGWDPQRRVGFEYVATSEGDPPVPPAWRAALADAGAHVLVIDETDLPSVERLADEFVAALPPAPAPAP